MKRLIIKDLNFRLRFQNIEQAYLTLKFIKRSLKNTSNEYYTKSSIVLKNNYRERYKILRRCPIVNRNKVSFSKLGISRTKLKELLTQNLVPGFKKAIW